MEEDLHGKYLNFMTFSKKFPIIFIVDQPLNIRDFNRFRIKDFIEKAKKMIPDINSNMFVKGNSGVRAQGMDSNGKLLMNFNIIKENNQIHILNAPSPGATASLSIADYIIKNNID